MENNNKTLLLEEVAEMLYEATEGMTQKEAKEFTNDLLELITCIGKSFKKFNIAQEDNSLFIEAYSKCYKAFGGEINNQKLFDTSLIEEFEYLKKNRCA